MAAETKLNTVLPNNNLKFAENITPISEVYVEKVNSFGPLENYTVANDVAISLNTFAWGSTATVQLSKIYRFYGPLVLKLSVTTTSTVAQAAIAANGSTSSLAVNPFGSNQLIGYSLIQSVSYRIPGCERQIFLGEHIPYMFLDEIQDLQKREQFHKLAGRAGEIGIIKPHIDNPTGTATDAIAAAAYTVTNDFYLVLPFPSSNLQEDPKKAKPFPVHLLGDSIEYLITFRNQTEVQSAETFPVTSGAYTVTKPTVQITNAQINFLYYQLGSPMEYKQVVCKYPMKCYYHSIYPIPNGSAGTTKQIVLSGMRNGEALGLRIKVTPALVSKIYEGVRLENFKFTYGGYTLWESKDGLQPVYEMLMGQLPAKTSPYMLDVVPVEKSYPNVPVHWTYWYHIPFAAKLEHLLSKHDYQLGVDFNNAEARLSFTMPDDAVSDGTPYNLHVDLIINSIVQLNGESAALIQ